VKASNDGVEPGKAYYEIQIQSVTVHKENSPCFQVGWASVAVHRVDQNDSVGVGDVWGSWSVGGLRGRQGTGTALPVVPCHTCLLLTPSCFCAKMATSLRMRD